MKIDRFDVVIVGGGLAGHACAIRCAEQGLAAAVLEQGEEELYACNSRYATGVVHCAHQYIRAAPAVLRDAIDRQTRGFVEAGLADVFAANAGPAVRWLAVQGVRMIKGGWDPMRWAMLAPPPPASFGHHWRGRGADLMMRRLHANLAAAGGRLMRGTRVRELVIDVGAAQGGQCIGVLAEHDGAVSLFEAAAVVLADGGFQADPELLRRHVSPHPERLFQRNAGTGRGDGIRMATEAGALLVGMDRFYGHALSRDAMSNPRLWPVPVMDSVITAGLLVDACGRRFADEGLGGIHAANCIAALEDPLETFAICDEAAWRGPASRAIRPPNPLLAKAGGTLIRAESIKGLARMTGLPATALAQTLADFNRSIDEAAPARLDPPRTPAYGGPMPVRNPPYYAIPLCAGITYTMGGIAIDTQCRVRRADGGVIPGLYAAGATTGGLEGGPVAGLTGGLSKAFTFGWHAGNCIGATLRPGATPVRNAVGTVPAAGIAR